MSVHEADVRQACTDGQEPDQEPDAVARSEAAGDVEQQRRDGQLDHEGERGQVPHGAEGDQLERARLEYRIGESAGPTAREQVLAAMDEVDEVAGIGPAVEVRDRRRQAQDRYPHAGECRTQQVPHLGRYRPR